jgi:hypothetical protein
MKLRYLKSIIPAAALTLALSVTSCVSDLDVNPLIRAQQWNLIKTKFLLKFMQHSA